MDTTILKKINFTLSAQNIIPYDILIALGNEAIVPNQIVKDRRQRVLKRDGKDTPEGYLRNSIEDLEKMSFANKDEMLALLRKQSSSTLAGFGSFSGLSTPVTLVGLLLLLAVPAFFFYKKKKKSFIMVSGTSTSANSSKKRRKKS